MDPDMVRQQAEAEREALALLEAKPAKPAPVSLPTEAAAQDTVQVPLRASAPHLEVAAAPAALPGHAPAPQAQLRPAQRKHTVAGRFGRFVSFGLAGAMLGGGLGIVAASYFDLPAELAKLAIFGPAGFFFAVCAVASFFTKAPEQ